MSLGGSFMPLGALLCLLGVKCAPPLKRARPPPYMCAPWPLLGPLEAHICPLGAQLCPLGLFYIPSGSSVHLPSSVRAPPRVVLSDVLGGKDVVEGRDIRTVGFVY
jgi:hypothetical protein